MLLDKRSSRLLKALIELYISDGQPVGSRTLSRVFDLSPATIRNVMADLEGMGLLQSPHASAGRVPTPQGYRIFVDGLLAVHRHETHEELNFPLRLPADEPLRSEEHTSELQSRGHIVCRLLLEKNKQPAIE